MQGDKIIPAEAGKNIPGRYVAYSPELKGAVLAALKVLKDIENAGKAAKNELRRFTAEQSVRMAEELIKRDLRPEDDLRLIGRNIEEMGAAR